jgi:hypothetical protein
MINQLPCRYVRMAGAWCLKATECGHRALIGVSCTGAPLWCRPGGRVATSTRGYHARMVSTELDGPDAPVCPLLGLAADRRSHFTYPHPGHRCFATEHPATTDARRQAAYCLSAGYAACDRYVARKRSQAGDRPQARQSSREASASPGGTPAGALIGAGTVIHVFRAGDSLTRIATVYGLTVEQIATANGFTLTDAVADGTRLVIPLGAPAVSVPGRDPRQTAGR